MNVTAPSEAWLRGLLAVCRCVICKISTHVNTNVDKLHMRPKENLRTLGAALRIIRSWYATEPAVKQGPPFRFGGKAFDDAGKCWSRPNETTLDLKPRASLHHSRSTSPARQVHAQLGDDVGCERAVTLAFRTCRALLSRTSNATFLYRHRNQEQTIILISSR